jgi:hypothetical protein
MIQNKTKQNKTKGCPVRITRLSCLLCAWLKQLPVPLDCKRRLTSIQVLVYIRFDHWESVKTCQTLVAEQTPVRRLSLADAHM